MKPLLKTQRELRQEKRDQIQQARNLTEKDYKDFIHGNQFEQDYAKGKKNFEQEGNAELIPKSQETGTEAALTQQMFDDLSQEAARVFDEFEDNVGHDAMMEIAEKNAILQSPPAAAHSGNIRTDRL